MINFHRLNRLVLYYISNSSTSNKMTDSWHHCVCAINLRDRQDSICRGDLTRVRSNTFTMNALNWMEGLRESSIISHPYLQIVYQKPASNTSCYLLHCKFRRTRYITLLLAVVARCTSCLMCNHLRKSPYIASWTILPLCLVKQQNHAPP